MSNPAVSMNPEKSLAELLQNGLHGMALSMSTEQQQRLLQYVFLLNKWNKTYNLTAVREPERMIGLHIIDSLAVLTRLGGATTVLDVGSGAGLPGIPIAIARADVQVSMLDSLQKKTAFIRQAIGEIGLQNAEVVCERVEQFQPIKKFDMVISRAFAELTDFVRVAAHLVATGGQMLAMKGVYPHEEIDRLSKNLDAPCCVDTVIKLNVPQVEGERHLVILKKTKESMT